MSGACKTEETMKLITRFELTSKPTGELHALRGQALKAFASAPGSNARRDALASLANIDAEIRSRPTL